MRQIIFDLDDTLYINKELRHRRNRALLEFLGKRSFEFIKLKKYYGTLDSLERMGISRVEFYRLMEKVEVDIDRDAKLVSLLSGLKKEYRLVVLSNSSKKCVEEVLIKLGVFDLIDEVYCGEDFEFVKPHEDCFFMIRRGDVCVGNSFEKDLKVPKGLGAVTILVGCSDKVLSEEVSNSVDYVVESIYDVVEVIG